MIVTILLVIAIGSYLWAIVSVREVLHFGWLRSLKMYAITEKNRNEFGGLRTRLMRLAREGEVNVRSSRFQVLYQCLSSLMQNPQAYKAAVSVLLRFPSEVKAKAAKGPEAVSENESKLIVDFAGAFDLLCRDFNFPYRIAAKLLDSKKEHVMPLWIRLKIAKKEAVNDVLLVHDARRELEQLCSAAVPT